MKSGNVGGKVDCQQVLCNSHYFLASSAPEFDDPPLIRHFYLSAARLYSV